MITLYKDRSIIARFDDRMEYFYPDNTRILAVHGLFDLIYWNYENDAELFVVIALKNYADEHGYKVTTMEVGI